MFNADHGFAVATNADSESAEIAGRRVEGEMLDVPSHAYSANDGGMSVGERCCDQ